MVSRLARCVGLLVRLAQAGGHGGQQLAGEGGHGIEDAVELALAEDEEVHFGLGGHAGRAGPAVEQGQLAEVLARSERGHLAVVALHRGLTGDDEEELPPDGALLAEQAARGHRDLLEGLADCAQVLGRRGREQPDLREVEWRSRWGHGEQATRGSMFTRWKHARSSGEIFRSHTRALPCRELAFPSCPGRPILTTPRATTNRSSPSSSALRYTMVKPDDSARAQARRAGDVEGGARGRHRPGGRQGTQHRLGGGAGRRLIVALFVIGTYPIHHAAANGQSPIRQHSLYHDSWFVLLGMAVLMLVTSWLAQAPLPGHRDGPLRAGHLQPEYWGFGFPSSWAAPGTWSGPGGCSRN